MRQSLDAWEHAFSGADQIFQSVMDRSPTGLSGTQAARQAFTIGWDLANFGGKTDPSLLVSAM